MKKISTSLALALFFGFPIAVAAAGSSPDKLTSETLASLEARAAAGNEKAQMKLATMYLEGRGVTADVDKAVSYYRLAAEREIPFAQYKLARLYLDGNHVIPDPEQALNWLLRSAKHGFVRAQLDLSLMYEKGSGIDRDFVKAHKWLSIASSLTQMDLEPRQEELAAKMTYSEVAYAEFLTSVCILTQYQDC